MREPRSYVVLSALAGGVLFYALRLSRFDRGPVDWAVIGLIIAAILWNLIQLGRRLHRSGGGKAVWHLQRTVLFWIIGLLNTVFLRAEDLGSWKNWVGWAVLLIAAGDTVALFLKERAMTQSPDLEPRRP
jgi:hypothetical protein